MRDVLKPSFFLLCHSLIPTLGWLLLHAHNGVCVGRARACGYVVSRYGDCVVCLASMFMLCCVRQDRWVSWSKEHKRDDEMVDEMVDYKV